MADIVGAGTVIVDKDDGLSWLSMDRSLPEARATMDRHNRAPLDRGARSPA